MDDSAHAIHQETPTSLLQSQLSICGRLVRCLYAIAVAPFRTGLAPRAALNWFRRWSVYLIKTFGFLIAITFGTASVLYAKQAADYARCQLWLAQRQYCEMANKESANSRECRTILQWPLFARPCQVPVNVRHAYWRDNRSSFILLAFEIQQGYLFYDFDKMPSNQTPHFWHSFLTGLVLSLICGWVVNDGMILLQQRALLSWRVLRIWGFGWLLYTLWPLLNHYFI